MIIQAVKPFCKYRYGTLHKTCRALDKITFKKFDYELEEYISLWLSKNHIKSKFEYERIETETEIIIKINTLSTISKTLRIDKTKLKEVLR